MLAENKGIRKSLDEFEFQRDLTTDFGVTRPCASGKSTYNAVNTLAPSFFHLIFFISAGKKDNYKVPNEFEIRQPWTAELAALDCLKKSYTSLRPIQNILKTCWLSGERSLPFGLLVSSPEP